MRIEIKHMQIDIRTFALMYWAAQTDDIRWPNLHMVEHMESHWAIDETVDDAGNKIARCSYVIGEHEPEQPQWPPVIEPGWSHLYRYVAGFTEKEKWLLQ